MSITERDFQLSPRPLSERVNFRMVVLIGLLLFLIGTPTFSFVKNTLNHGIEKTSDRFNVDLKALGNFRFDDSSGTVSDVPAQFRKLDGKRVALEGFVAPDNSAGRSINAFTFVYNIQKCCFNGPPLVQERVFATVPENRTIYYSDEEIRIIGILHVSAEKDEVGKIEQVYSIDVERAEPL